MVDAFKDPFDFTRFFGEESEELKGAFCTTEGKSCNDSRWAWNTGYRDVFLVAACDEF